MSPTSIWLLVTVAIVAVLGLFGVIKLAKVWLRALLGVVLVASGAFLGLIGVNDYYGYYQTWGALAQDFGNGGLTPTSVRNHHGDPVAGAGSVRAIWLAGASSGIRRVAYVYLPPQYHQQRFAHVRFPVIELFHGSPGSPSNWTVQLRIVQAMQSLMRHHAIGPAVLVMPSSNDGHHYEECLNANGVADETYLTSDVRQAIEHRFRVSPNPHEWGVGGFSSGGYCAANLALRHPSYFGAAFTLDGYFDPSAGPAADLLHHDPAALAANNPLLRAAATQWGRPVPAFWVASGTDPNDYAQARALVSAFHGVERVPLIVERGAKHNYYAWAAALPLGLSWIWQQISPPGLRDDFPVAGRARSVDITPRNLPMKHGAARPDVAGSGLASKPIGAKH